VLLRHLLAVLMLPFVVVIIVPRWLLRSAAAAAGGAALLPFAQTMRDPVRIAGVAIILAGLALFVWCLTLFDRVGRGTLAPWDPTKRLVVRGPYRHMRNPMITGVLAMLVGEAMLFRSRPIAVWALLVFAINHSYFLLLEEPGLVARFGEEYRRYRDAVPRWIPRWKGWP
jgi:protein-S-isoprenylcysteine O-methyltransferase Ste14